MKTSTAIFVGVGGVLAAAYLLRLGIDNAADSIGNVYDDIADGNFISDAVDELGGVLTGRDNFSLGSYLYDVFNTGVPALEVTSHVEGNY